MSKIKIAIVGTGGIANVHAEAAKAWSDRAQLVAGLDIDAGRAEQFCDKHEIPRSYTDLGKLLAEEKPELVSICTPPGLHAKLSVQAMRGGADVLCEKPLCASLAEYDQIAQAEKETGKHTSCVFQFRFGSGGLHLKSLMEAGELGRPLVAQCVTTWFRGTKYYNVPWRGKWDTELGGPTMGHGIHAMDMFLWIMGPWTQVKADMATLDRDLEVEDVSLAMVRFANGAMGSITNSILCPRQETWTRFDYQNATAEVRHLYGYTNDNWSWTKAPHVSDELFEKWQTLPEEVSASHHSQYGSMIERIQAGRRPRVSGEAARGTIEFLTAMYKAAITDTTVQQGSIKPGDPFYEALHGGHRDAFGLREPVEAA